MPAKRGRARGPWGRELDLCIELSGLETLQEVADLLGVHEGTVRHWRRGRQTPSEVERRHHIETLRHWSRRKQRRSK